MSGRFPAFPAPPVEAGVYQPFWDAIARGRLELPRCQDCGRWVWYPAPRCPGCASGHLEWTPVAGTGALFTYSVVHRQFLPGVEVTRPFVVGLVELDGAPGVRLVADVDVAPTEVRIGMPLRVRFDAGRPLFEAVPSTPV